MKNEKKIVPFQDALFTLAGENTQPAYTITKNYIDLILEGDYSLVCVNKKEQKKRSMTFRALYTNNKRFWLQGSSWDFFIAEEDIEDIRNKAAARSDTWIPKEKAGNNETDEPSDAASFDIDSSDDSLPIPDTDEDGYGPHYEAIAAMTLAQQVELLNINKKKLDDLIEHNSDDIEAVTETLVESTQDAALINHSALMEAMNVEDDEAKLSTSEIVSSTYNMIKSSAQLVSTDVLSDELMNILVEKSNGTIIQHMTRVYLNGIAFLSYYNNRVSSSSSSINRLRIDFKEKYRKTYSALLPHLASEDITLERVFYRGMRSIPPNLFFHWAVGFLVHDIGKASAVEYHEGEKAYDRDIVVEHVKLGYNSLINKTNYPKEAGLIAGYHHEYYGAYTGYGYFRGFQEQYRKKNPNAKQDFCIAYEIEPVMECKTLAYFPAKVLEIIDIYDSMTDPKRKYHKALTQEEALATMREDFIDKSLKIDPILFDFFCDFMNEKNSKKAKT